MEELLFFAVIIFFSIIESVARSRKAKKGGGSADSPPDLPSPREREVEERFEWAQKPVDELPTYDEEPSYDERIIREGSAAVPDHSRGELRADRPSSETMLPGNLLEELAGLLDGSPSGTGARTLDLPGQSPPLPDRSRPEPAPARVESTLPARRESRSPARRETHTSASSSRRGPARTLGSHSVHQAHAGYGTDPSARAKSEQDGLDPLATTLSEDARAIRQQLRSHRPSELRRAVILQEVLATPLALRGDALGH